MTKNTLSIGLFFVFLFPISASAQAECNAKKMSFTEFTSCAEAAIVKDTQGICTSGAKCFNGEVNTIVSLDDGDGGAPVVSDTAPSASIDIATPSPDLEVIVPEVNLTPKKRVVNTLSEAKEVTPVAYSSSNPVQEVGSQGGYEARVLFALGSADLLNASNSELDEIANVMLSKPHLKLAIEGHASADGDEGYNLSLSSQRAGAVRDALTARRVPVERLSYRGFGESRLKDLDNPNSPENRRVEMVLDFSVN